MVINPIVGVYIPIIRIPIQGGMTIPKKNATFDHGTYAFVASISYNSQNKVGLGKRLGRSYLSTVTTMIMIMMSTKIDLATKNLWLINLTPPNVPPGKTWVSLNKAGY